MKNNSKYISNRTMRYLNRTIKKNNNEIIGDKKKIKFLIKSLENMTDYAYSSYYNNIYLINLMNRTFNNNNIQN